MDILKLLAEYDQSKKPELFVNSLTNYERHVLRFAIGIRANFPETFEQKIIESARFAPSQK